MAGQEWRPTVHVMQIFCGRRWHFVNNIINGKQRITQPDRALISEFGLMPKFFKPPVNT
jgi:hypothetical protein